jgi:hypothetical protein
VELIVAQDKFLTPTAPRRHRAAGHDLLGAWRGSIRTMSAPCGATTYNRNLVEVAAIGD